MRSRVKKQQVELRAMVKNKRTCCICHDPHKEIQIHHIDGNPENNAEENLSILCLHHHSQATAGLEKGKTGFGSKLTPEEVRLYKKAWEAKVAGEFNVEKKVIPLRKRKQLEILYEFEINKIKNKILSLTNKSQGPIRQDLNFFTQLLIEEFISGIKLRKIVLEALSDIAVQSAGQQYLSMLILPAIGDLHIHLIGPKDVPISKEDKKALLKSLDILETIGSYAASITDNEIVLKKTLSVIAELAGLSSLYKFKDPASKSVKILNQIRKDVFDYDHPKLKEKEIEKKKQIRIGMVEDTLREIKKL